MNIPARVGASLRGESDEVDILGLGVCSHVLAGGLSVLFICMVGHSVFVQFVVVVLSCIQYNFNF